MRRPPTDLKILRLIHKRYLAAFGNFDASALEPDRSSKIYVPIDCAEVAKSLKVDPDIVFGRLYYHLDKKYGYTNSDGSRVHLFAFAIGTDRHAVNFPLLSAVLAELEESAFRFNAPFVLSAAAILLSILALSGKCV